MKGVFVRTVVDDGRGAWSLNEGETFVFTKLHDQVAVASESWAKETILVSSRRGEVQLRFKATLQGVSNLFKVDSTGQVFLM